MKHQLKLLLKQAWDIQAWAYGLFWSWNVIFLAFMLLGFAPQMLPELITAVKANNIPFAFLMYAFFIAGIPFVAVLIGGTILWRHPYKLLALGYGVEGPLMILIAVRLFAIRQATPVVAILLSLAGAGMLTFLWQLLDQHIDERGKLLTYVRGIGLTLMLVLGLYAGIWLSFYTLPIGKAFLEAVGDFFSNIGYMLDNIRDMLATLTWRNIWVVMVIPFWVLGMILMAYSATLFLGLPLAGALLYSRAWWHSMKRLYQENQWGAVAVPVLTIALTLVLVNLNSGQPQHDAFALLEETPQSVNEAQKIAEQEDDIRAGLLNSYLARQRYISATGEVHHVKEMYEFVGLSEADAQRMQEWYEWVASPVLYQPVHEYEQENRWQSAVMTQEPETAAKLYQGYFDEPIVDGERETILDAVGSTWSADDARRNWQLVEDKEIYLTHQEITVEEQGDWAEIELYEVYQNQTAQRQEVIYYFSLPETAVLTGVWLGTTPERDERFVYRVSPRGAAQEIYRNEVRRNTDPALLEQIGPRQYRLRIFPVEPMRWDWNDETRHSILLDGPPLYMWMTWRVLAKDNQWAVPNLAIKNNVYWDDNTERLVNGVAVEGHEEWLPASLAASQATSPQSHRVEFANGTTVIAQPINENEIANQPAAQRLAVILDRSRSMVKVEDDVNGALSYLTELAKANHTVDLYLTASELRGEGAYRVPIEEYTNDDLFYFGGQNAAELLAQFDELRGEDSYDAVLVLTDGSGYELGEPNVTAPVLDFPVWMVHLGKKFPLGYDDGTLEAIQGSGGGSVSDVQTAWTRLTLPIEEGTALRDVIDGYEWLVVETENAGTLGDIPLDGAFAPFAARQLILAETAQQRATLGELTTLDDLHAIAVSKSIVTPYSSMIVLVNTQQERLLDQLEQGADRFDREYEALQDTTGINVTGVPEPEEWLLLFIVTGMLLWYLDQQGYLSIRNLLSRNYI